MKEVLRNKSKKLA